MPLNGQFLDKSGLTYLWSKLKTKFAAKQDSIADLTAIRSGAAAGSTAVQPADMSTALAVKQDKLTFDSSPTESSTNPVTSGGVWTDQQRQETEIGAVANAGAKNLLKITASSQTIQGVTFTVNSDGTVTVNGQNTGSTSATFVIVPNADAVKIPDGNYILSGCPSGGGDPTYDLRWYRYSPNRSAYDRGTGAEVSKSGNTVDSNIAIVVKAGVTVNNLVFKPMLCPASITDNTFVPYAKTNRELTVAGDEDRAALIAQVDGGAKNILNLNTNFTSHTHKGITYTNNGDGTINVSGTSNVADSYVTLYDSNEDNLFGFQIGETVALQSTSNTVSINLVYKKQGGGYGLTVYGYKDSPATFTIPSDFVGFMIRIGVPRNNTTVDENVSAMICTAADYAISPAFVPYAKTNRELTVAGDEDRAALIAQVDGGAKNFLDTSVSTLKKYNTASSAVWNGSSYTQNGITYSVNPNGTISVSGTATSTSLLVLANRTYLNTKIARGRYSISGCPTGGGSSGATYRIFCLNPNANISNGYTDTGNGYIGEFYYNDSKDCNIAIGVGKGCVITDPVVFKPMLCTAADWAISQKFVPYAPTNRELWQKINAIKRTYKVPISCTPVNGIYFGVQMFPFEFDSVPEGTVAVQNVGQGGVAIDPTKFTAQINTWGFRIYTKDSTYAGLIPDVKFS